MSLGNSLSSFIYANVSPNNFCSSQASYLLSDTLLAVFILWCNIAKVSKKSYSQVPHIL